MASNKDDRIFVRNGRRSYRRRFNATETHIGIFVVLGLIAVLAWVFWKGANPDPALFALDIDLSQPGEVTASVDRGPVPLDLIVTGWSEGTLSEFDNDNLYIKINGREGYYKGFGFQRLYSLSLLMTDDAQTAVDIELYDLGNAANAVGAYAGERSADTRPRATESGLMHIERNALYLTRGRYYLRAIGSSESPGVITLLEHLQDRFASDLPSEPLPWGFALFAGKMGLDPGAIAYAPENAFSFGFANNVYSATLHDGSEVFVTPGSSASAAIELARRFEDGFRQYGTAEGDFVKDRYRDTYAAAAATGIWVVGVHRAPTTAAASTALTRIANAVRDLPLPEGETSEREPEANVEQEYGGDEY